MEDTNAEKTEKKSIRDTIYSKVTISVRSLDIFIVAATLLVVALIVIGALM